MPGCVPQDSTSHCSGRILAVNFSGFVFKYCYNLLYKQRLTCEFAAPPWSPWAAAGGDSQRDVEAFSPPELACVSCHTSVAQTPSHCFWSSFPVPAAWALPFPPNVSGEQQPRSSSRGNSPAAPLFLKEGSSQGKGSQEDGEVIPGTQSTAGAQIPGHSFDAAPAEPRAKSCCAQIILDPWPACRAKASPKVWGPG